jgi:predicted nucleic acid-binding OB-fold protein
LKTSAPLKLAAQADELLGSIDLALNKSGSTKVQDVKTASESKSKASDSIKEDIDRRDLADASKSELKTVVNVITELSEDLREKVSRHRIPHEGPGTTR